MLPDQADRLGSDLRWAVGSDTLGVTDESAFGGVDYAIGRSS